MEQITVEPLHSHPHLIEICALWNLEEFGSSTRRSLADTISILKEIAVPGSCEEALVAHCGDKPAGFALLIDCDLKSHAHLKPWLASLYVDPPFRRKGAGRMLVASIEQIAKDRGDSEIFLYTPTPAYYRPLGWRFFEAIEKDGQSFEIMSKRLNSET